MEKIVFVQSVLPKKDAEELKKITEKTNIPDAVRKVVEVFLLSKQRYVAAGAADCSEKIEGKLVHIQSALFKGDVEKLKKATGENIQESISLAIYWYLKEKNKF